MKEENTLQHSESSRISTTPSEKRDPLNAIASSVIELRQRSRPKKQPEPALRADFLKALGDEVRIANLAKQQSEGRVVS